MPERAPPIAVIITALGVETSAVLRHIGKTTVETVGGTGFFRGRFEAWDVAVVEAGPGNASAAAIAVRALTHYKPDVALFVGVAGGIKDVAIGDVVVATKVYGYESGKDTATKFLPRPDVQNTAHELEQRGRIIRQQEDWKKRLDPRLKHAGPTIFVEPIAAGEKVVASTRSPTAKLIKEKYGDAIAVEMEGRGFLEGVHISHPINGAVIRGISDLLSKKGEADKAGSQKVAADAASAAAFEILAGLTGSPRPAAKPKPSFVETPSTFSRGAYFQQRQVLAEIGVPDVDQVSCLRSAVGRQRRQVRRHAILVWTKEWLGRMMVVGNVVAASTYSDCVDAKGYIIWERVKPVAFCGAPYVNMFAAAIETMEVGMPYEGPEVAAADKSVRSYFDDM